MNMVKTKRRGLAWAVCAPAAAAMLLSSAGAANAATATETDTPPWVEAVQVVDGNATANGALSDCIPGGSKLFAEATLVGNTVDQDGYTLFPLDTDKDGKADSVYAQGLGQADTITDVFGVGATTFEGTYAHVFTAPPTGAATCTTGALITVKTTPTPDPTDNPTGEPTGDPTDTPTDTPSTGTPTTEPTDGVTQPPPTTDPTDDGASGGSVGGGSETPSTDEMMGELDGLDFADASGCGPLGELSAKFVQGVDDGSIVLDESDYSISPDGKTITAVVDVAGDGSPDLRYVFTETASTVEGDTDNNGSYDSKYVLGEDTCTTIATPVTNAVPTAKTDGADLAQASLWSQVVTVVKVAKAAALASLTA